MLLKTSTLETIFKNILLQWTTVESDVIQYSYYCTDKFGFKLLFLMFLDRHIRECVNKGNHIEELITFKNYIDVCGKLL